MKDIILNDDDLMFINEDFFISDSQNQSIELLLKSKQGEWKRNPEAGCNIHSAKSGLITRSLDRNIRLQLEADDFNIQELEILSEGINILGNYETI